MHDRIASANVAGGSKKSLRLLIRIVAGAIIVIGLALLVGGAWLAKLGGSYYYLLAGGAYLLAAVQMWRLRSSGAWLAGGMAVVTLAWALWERGADFWALFPRLLMPFGMAAGALLLSAPLLARKKRLAMFAAGTLALALTGGQFALAFFEHGAIQAEPGAPFNLPKVDNVASDWTAYGRTTAGTRYAPFDQINRSNVAQLDVAWTFHHGDTGPGVDQNTPLLIGDTMYTCSPNDIVAAIDADTGALRWRHDPHATGPTWQRCRGLSYYTVPAAANASSSNVCAQRIINGTTDGRVIALDAKSGEPCSDFGDHGQLDLRQNMGLVEPGFAFETSAPLVARNNIIVADTFSTIRKWASRLVWFVPSTPAAAHSSGHGFAARAPFASAYARRARKNIVRLSPIALFSPPTLRDSLIGFLRHAVEAATEKGSAPGCLMVCVAPLVDDAEVRQFLQDAVCAGVALVEGRFRDGISAREIPSDFPVTARASQVLDLARGLTMRAQMGTPRKTLLKDAEEAADLALLPRRG